MARRSRTDESAVATLEPVESTPVDSAESLALAAPKPLREIVEEFLSTVANHPDGKLLTVQRRGTPNRHEAFPATPLPKQEVLSVRMLVREE